MAKREVESSINMNENVEIMNGWKGNLRENLKM
jgi:hypothetical protein